MVTISLVPAVVSFAAVPLDPDPGMVTVNLIPAVLVFEAVALNPVAPTGTVNLTPAVLVFEAVALDPDPGMVTVNLTPAVLAFEAVALDPEGIVIIMSVYGPPPLPAQPCSWDVNVTCCGAFWLGLDPDLQLAAAEYGSFTVWAATGRRFGLCERTVRPCGRTTSDGAVGYFWTEGTWRPYIFNGQWRNCGGCGSSLSCCTCRATCEVWLPGPVAGISPTGVSVDGEIIPVDAWRVDDGQWLVRTDGDCWPDCQDYDADTGTGVFAVTYHRGIAVPSVLLSAAGELACEWAKSCLGVPCRLPGRVSSIARQGVSITMADVGQLLQNGLTGVATVDQLIRNFNPYGLVSRMKISSPDDPAIRTTTIP